MKPRQSTKDRVEGTARSLKGKAKKAVGQVVGDRHLENEGKIEEFAGKAQRKGGEIERVFED